MNITLPIYVERLQESGTPPIYQARPLFFPGPRARGEHLDRLLTRLMQELGQHLTELSREARHDALAAYTFYPRLAQERFDLTLILRRRTAQCRFLFVSFRQFGRRIAFTPGLPDVWFDVARGERLRDRAGEVLTKHFRDQEREDGEVRPELWALKATAHVTPLELTIHPPARPPERPKTRFLMLGGDGPMSGSSELRRVGRCLDWLYPDDLDRAVLRDTEVAELTRLLNEDNRPVLLLGPRQVGKTALIHEYVRREVARRPSPFGDRGNVWLLAPARLISGMSYVGQWEDRLLAILKEARKRNHLLYFDDLLGLFLAGQTGSSALSVADVLKPHLEQRRVRLVAEITPEAFRVLREKDRGFADLFHVLPVNEPADDDTLRILIGVQRNLEDRHRCRFELEVLPTVIDLERRFHRDLAFPGKAAGLLRQLAVKHANSAGRVYWPGEEGRAAFDRLFSPSQIARSHALEEFHAQSGLAVTFLDRHARLERQQVLEAIGKNVVGQEAAVQAAADVIAIAKARLNDPDRPLAAFLFLGPTGVGKTQCAKALAAYLFGDAERLLRFDLNEYGSPGAAARLVGTFRESEGLLTGAIRRQPFAVVLLDEVEKAHPEVFDLLLQVLGEGRLTDALGRTADFSNALIVLTSNLGVRESESQLGFRQDEATRDALFVQAAQRFFRPEFFNRLDRVLPFHRLTREQIQTIAQRLIEDVFQREGLAQRKCVLATEPAAMERIVDQGYDPILGARALKRAVECELAQPVAAQLASLPPGNLTVVRVYPGQRSLQVRVEALEEVPRLPAPAVDMEDGPELLRRVRAAVHRIEAVMHQLRPEGAVTLGQVSAEQYRYFALREQVETVRASSRELEERSQKERFPESGRPSYSHIDWPRKTDVRSYDNALHFGNFLRDLAAALDINDYLREMAEATLVPPPDMQELQELLRQCALLELIAQSIERPPAAHRALVLSYPVTRTSEGLHFSLNRLLVEAFRQAQLEVTDFGAPSRSVKDVYHIVDGLHALPLAQSEAGIHLFCPLHAPLCIVRVEVWPLPATVEAAAFLADWSRKRRDWLAALATGSAVGTDDPLTLGSVRRIYDGREGAFDPRCGLHAPRQDLATFLLASLPLPPEILDPAS